MLLSGRIWRREGNYAQTKEVSSSVERRTTLVPAQLLTRARVRLLSAEEKTDDFIIAALKEAPQTIPNIRKRFAENGLEAALSERPRPGIQRKLDGKQSAVKVKS